MWGDVLMAFGAIGIVLGATAAVGASRFPAYQVRLEQGAGVLIVLGLILVGLGFPQL
jgi:hypothetical protein